MQLANGGDIRQLLINHGEEKRQTPDHGEAYFMFIFFQMVDAVRHCHVNKIVHRDIKPENFLVHDGKVLIADFGLAAQIHSSSARMNTASGTYVYSAPEIIDNEDYDSKVDVFSLGVVLYELLLGERQNIAMLWRGKGKLLPEKFSEPTRALYEWMISVDPKERPSIYSVYGRVA